MGPEPTLATQVADQVLACIGCHDCLSACPLPQAQTVTIAELNFAVTQPTVTHPLARAFFLACTQCQQCVPVCPADLSRADMVLFNKIKLEDVLPDEELLVQTGAQVAASGWTRSRLAAHLTGFALFEGVEVNALRRLLLKVTLRQLATGEVLCEEGVYHERLYVVLAGQLEQSGGGVAQSRTRILVLGPGAFHGEVAVMANNPEQYTLQALQPTLVLEISRAVLRQLMGQAPVFNQTLQELYRRRAVWTHVMHSPILKILPAAALEALIKRAELRSLQPGEQLFAEGAPAEQIYLLRNGFLKVSRRFQAQGERVLLYFREGDVFGVRALLLGEPRLTVTVTANTRAEVICISAALFMEIVGQYPGALAAVQAAAAQAESTALVPPAAAGPRTMSGENTTQLSPAWRALLDQGVIQSHELLVINQNLCTSCNNCVEACARRHGYSRLNRSGLQVDHLLFPTACRHCEDPVCLLCSVNGIVRQPNGEIAIVDANCIGCGACADRCPYHNIQMHPVHSPPPQTNFLLDLWAAAFGPPRRAAPDPAAPQLAVKCDLCVGHPDYACVTACPVGAAFRIDPVTAFGRNDLLIGLEMKRQRGAEQP